MAEIGNADSVCGLCVPFKIRNRTQSPVFQSSKSSALSSHISDATPILFRVTPLMKKEKKKEKKKPIAKKDCVVQSS